VGHRSWEARLRRTAGENDRGSPAACGGRPSGGAAGCLRCAVRRWRGPARAALARAAGGARASTVGGWPADRALPADRGSRHRFRVFRTLTAGGIEGLVIKDRQGVYPTREGQRVWWKVKTKATLDMLAIGYTGTTTALTSLVLAFPGEVDEDGEPVTAGSTTVLARTVTKRLLPLLRPTGRTFERAFAWGTNEPTTGRCTWPSTSTPTRTPPTTWPSSCTTRSTPAESGPSTGSRTALAKPQLSA